MGRGAPRQSGLDYFPKMVNFYDNDDKIFDLLDRYGPLGVTIYDCILTIVYANGYYANLSKDKLSRMVIKKIGNKWIKDKQAVVQVIDYCADLDLFRKDLMQQNIITSVGIQKRYYKIAVKLMKRRLYSKDYWLLDEEGEPLLNSAISRINSEENRINSEVKPFSSENTAINKRKEKENKRKYISPELQNSPDKPAYELQLIDGNMYPVWEQDIKKFGLLYPAVDVEQEFRKMIGWLDSNPKNRKTSRGIKRFINGWLCRAQDSARPQRQTEKQGKPVNRFKNFEERQQQDYESMIWSDMRKRSESGGGSQDGGDYPGNDTG